MAADIKKKYMKVAFDHLQTSKGHTDVTQRVFAHKEHLKIRNKKDMGGTQRSFFHI